MNSNKRIKFKESNWKKLNLIVVKLTKNYLKRLMILKNKYKKKKILIKLWMKD